jgi:hypothetical protein
VGVWLLLGGCAGIETVPADLQLDVEAGVPTDAATLRVCVAGQGALVQGAGNGRAVVNGLRTDTPARVVVSLLDEAGLSLGTTEAVTLDAETPWAAAAWSPDAPTCRSSGDRADADAPDTWNLAVRFDEAA